jgi:pimeloyl-ACP methyl ester carboxylesterase
VVSATELEDRLNQCITLSDGRTLGFAEYGDLSGRPVLFFPGTPSGRLFHHPDESIALSLGARIITIDRPGFGLSDFQPGRSLLDWPADVVQLVDALGIHRFSVVGISGGGPYVAACVFEIPQRLATACIVSGVGPLDWPGATAGLPRARRLGAALATHTPRLVRPFLWLASNPRRNAERFFDQISAQSAPVDREILARPEVREMLIENWVESNRRGLRGYAQEAVIFCRPWGFPLGDLTMQVQLWQGTADAVTPSNIVRRVKQAIPDCQARFLRDEGHFLLFDHWAEILAATDY